MVKSEVSKDGCSFMVIFSEDMVKWISGFSKEDAILFTKLLDHSVDIAICVMKNKLCKGENKNDMDR